MIVVSDTSPISNLVMVNHIHLLPAIFGQIIIPNEVLKELLANGENHTVTRTVQSVGWLEVRHVRNLAAVAELERAHNLDPGEAHAIILATELQANQLLIDERLGRAEAKRRGLSLVGVLGVLLVAKQQRLIPTVQPVMDELIQVANFRIRRRLYDEVLSLSGE